jgi:hypothetical protein
MSRYGRSIRALLCFAASTFAGCVYSQPQSLVASNIRPTTEPLTVGKRVGAEVCGSRVLWIPFEPQPRMTTVMDALQAKAPTAIGFENIQVDTSWINYLFPLFWQQCVRASGNPLFR